MKISPRILAIFIITMQSLLAQRTFETISKQKGFESLDLFKEFLSLPNDAGLPMGIKKNIAWTQEKLTSMGFDIKILETSSLPLMIAKQQIDKNLPTLAFYMHLDGQAIDRSQWNQPDPYQAVLKIKKGNSFETVDWSLLGKDAEVDYRIFARSSADDKGPFIMLLTALDYLKEINQSPAFNIKLVLDFEEEQSSPGLPEAVQNFKDDLLADLLLILDGPMHASGLPTLVFGNRGISSLTLTTYGPITPQHSGHYGNYLPNPALTLSKILATMKDDEGRVIIPGFYDGITLTDEVKKLLRQVPSEDESIKQRTQTRINDQVGEIYQESIQYPSLNIRGLKSGWVGKEARTIIPSTATAEIDIRLVLESKPEKLIEGVRKHISEMGFKILDHEPTKNERLQYDKIVRMNSKIAYPAFRTETHSKEGKWLTKLFVDYYNQPPVIIRTSGGSVPISPFVSQLGVPAIGVPTVNLDNNQHSPNENLRFENYWKGIETFLAILTTPF
ncbi:MAG: M20/M25/M40 family metallo-hydrolase [Flavobacteriaceae bacterium]